MELDLERKHQLTGTEETVARPQSMPLSGAKQTISISPLIMALIAQTGTGVHKRNQSGVQQHDYINEDDSKMLVTHRLSLSPLPTSKICLLKPLSPQHDYKNEDDNPFGSVSPSFTVMFLMIQATNIQCQITKSHNHYLAKIAQLRNCGNFLVPSD